MKGFKIFHVFAVLVTLSVISVKGQITTPCTSSMTNGFTPCMNYLTGSTANGTSPTRNCCESLKSLVSSSVECACLMIAANIPIPINRTLALSLPRACNMGVPVQCKSSAAPLPAPGPALLGPTLAPIADSPLSPRASKASALAPAPESDTSDTTVDLAPASSPLPKTTSGIRPVLTPPPPSASSHISPPAFMLAIAGIMIFKCF